MAGLGQRLFNAVRHAFRGTRRFQGAQNGRLGRGSIWGTLPLDDILRTDLAALRHVSRDLALNNDYMRHYLSMVCRNVVGDVGVTLQNRARLSDGTIDKQTNDHIEAAWTEWGRKGTCTVCGRLSWRGVQNMVMSSTARDGEVLIRFVHGFPNRFGFALQVIAADHLDDRLNVDLRDGRVIRMGIERDMWGRPLAWHIKRRDPARYAREHERVPVEDGLHMYLCEDPDQSRGFPWACSTMQRLKMLSAYEEAALVAARVGASKMGFLQRQADIGAQYSPKDDKEPLINEVAPGQMAILDGYEFKAFDPGYPNGEMPFFMKTMLRGVAAGLGVSYNGLANDLEGVNFSSLRAGALDERDHWRTLQTWLIESLHERVFPVFLKQAILSQAVQVSLGNFETVCKPQWFPRRWKWVDPDKEGKANARDIGLGLVSRTQLAADQGRDLREVLSELAEEEKFAKEMGVTLSASEAGSPVPVEIEKGEDQ